MALVSRKKLKSLLAIGMVLSALGTTAYAAELVVVGGELRGATGITVGTTDYDVTFVDGSFSQLVADGDLQIVFDTQTLAFGAANALVDQVFNQNDDPQAHPGGIPNFDSNPELTFGITNTDNGFILTPYLTTGSNALTVVAAVNGAGAGSDFSEPQRPNFSDDVSGPHPNSAFFVYANWSPASNISAVPEPSTYAMMGLGLLGVAAMRRRKNQA